jgi:NAD(P)-dependent dehydrogenase (short-subunit alcohol dehydrogenase family)
MERKMIPDMFRLDGKVVLVTGATGHLGRAMSAGLAAAGASLAVCSTSSNKARELARELTDRFHAPATGFDLDISDLAAITPAVEEIVLAMGRLDCLVNNALFGTANNLGDVSLQEWATGLAGGASGPFFLMQACLPHLEKAKGNVINIGSMYGMVSPKPQNYADTPFGSSITYGAAKAALLQITRYAASYLGPKGIRVNAISPGPFPSAEVQKNSVFIERLASNVPLGRIGQPQEIQGAVVFLASSASSYITGHNLVIDGGWTIW